MKYFFLTTVVVHCGITTFTSGSEHFLHHCIPLVIHHRMADNSKQLSGGSNMAGMKKKKKEKKRKEATFVKVERTLNLQGEKVSAK